MTNVPYGMIMMTTNEWLRGVLEDGLYGFHEHHHYGDEKPFHFATILFSGMGAGMVALAVTAPLDRVKTRLQTQRMGMMIPSMLEEEEEEVVMQRLWKREDIGCSNGGAESLSQDGCTGW